MKKIIYNKLGLFILLSALGVACSEDKSVTESVVSSFAPYAPSLSATTPAVVVDEVDGDVYTFTFFTDENQIGDVTLNVHAGASSTATEHVDFEILTTEVDLLAFQGNDGFDVSIQLLQDYEADEVNERIYLSFSSDTPDGVSITSEVLTLTIRDSDVVFSNNIDMVLSWEFDNADVLGAFGAESACDVISDWDLTVYPLGSGPYNPDDLFGYAMSTGACPEHGTMDATDMIDGDIYLLWIIFWGGVDVGQFNDMSAIIDYSRLGTTLEGQLVVSGYSSADAGVAAIPFYLIRVGDVVTIYDAATDAEVASGRYAIDGKDLTKYEGLVK